MRWRRTCSRNSPGRQDRPRRHALPAARHRRPRRRSAAAGDRPPTSSCSTPPAAKTDEEIANAREATRIAELGYPQLLEHRAARHERGRACGRAQVVHEDARRRGQFPAALRRAAQSRGAALDRPQDAERRHHAGRDHAELARPARADLPHRPVVGERRPSSRTNTRWWCTPWMHGIAAARPGVPMAEVCRAINTVLEAKGYGEYCHPPHIRRRGHGLGFALDAAGRRGARQRHACSSPAWCS